ncbi:hypothetical protein G5B47_19470 [Paenibacillus sp. 7124]|uniref:Uncharacterized protein n=1 Tax=Paenibacillus apii TaxID=1850370 RepID=A0A6M1PRE6_9BACL|nr:hypothetical protein [Paenibacillus apii]NGM84592.1 hypothetical protein [Paenibacillus apii]NJJ40289.1 hypothetical protein [Paenibacillus apii]
MLTALQGEKAAVYFLDGTFLGDGVLEEVGEKFIKYVTDYQVHYIPITAIRSVSVETRERQRPRVGFGQ